MNEQEKINKLIKFLEDEIINIDKDFIFDRTEEIRFKDSNEPLFKSEFLHVLNKMKAEKLLEEIKGTNT